VQEGLHMDGLGDQITNLALVVWICVIRDGRKTFRWVAKVGATFLPLTLHFLDKFFSWSSSSHMVSAQFEYLSQRVGAHIGDRIYCVSRAQARRLALKLERNTPGRYLGTGVLASGVG